jgi:branched-chain amino acid transport system permease protein
MSHPNNQFSWKQIILYGILGGGIAVYLGLVGMVEAFGERYIINGIITMGQVLLVGPIFMLAYLVVGKLAGQSAGKRLGASAVAGFFGGLMLTALLLFDLLLLSFGINMRNMFLNASPALFQLITFGIPLPAGAFVPLIYGSITGLVAGAIGLLSANPRRAIINALVTVIVVGLVRDLLITVINRWGPVTQYLVWLFAKNGLYLIGAVIIFVLVFAVSLWSSSRPPRTGPNPMMQKRPVRYSVYALGILFLLSLPPLLGIFFSETLNTVGLFILMGLGLNIVVGYAGLLDLGYVAFYAIGAYTVGVLTSPELGFANLTYWQAVPFALLAAVLAGVILGLPVLRLRGDYLAIVTLGFGEIVRLLFLSDWLKPYVGGTQGIQSIAQPHIGPIVISTPQDFYYLILVYIAIALFVASRLKGSRMGRAWMSLREDEDVSEAMGLNTVMVKLLAFGTGALFSGLAGTVFAAKLTSVYPHSMNFIVSINVLALIIVGGMGSVPGVVVGALVLVGFPELLREFSEYRLLVYGAVLVAMMLYKPEGLWPEARRKLELHEEAEIVPE